MKVKTDLPSLAGPLSKGSKTKGQLISNLLSEAMAHIKIKNEPVSEEESTTNTSFKLDSRGKSPKQNGLDSRYLISKLVYEETKDMTKKKKRKSHNNSQDLSSSVPAPNKIKLEKTSEDEFTPLKTNNKLKDNFLLNEKGNKSNRDIFNPVKVKKESDYDILLTKERDMLEKLFSKSDNILGADSSKNKLKHRSSLPNPKHTDMTKRTFHNQSLPANYLGDKNSFNSTHGSDDSSGEFQVSLPKSTKKIDRRGSNVSNKLIEDTPIKSKLVPTPLKAKHSSSESEADVPLPKQIKKEVSATKLKEKKQKQALINLTNKLEHDKSPVSDSSSESDSSGRTNKKSFEKKRYRLESFTTPSLKKAQGTVLRNVLRDSDTESSSEEEVPKPQKIKTQISKVPGARTATKSRATFSSSRESEGELVPSQKKNLNNTSPTVARVPRPLQIKRNKKSSGSESEAELPLPKQVKEENLAKSKSVYNQAVSYSSSDPHPSKGRESFNKTKLVDAPIKSHKQRVQVGNKQNIDIVRRNESESESSSEEEVPVPQPRKIKLESSKTPKTTVQPSSRKMEKRNAASSDSEDELVPSIKKEDSPSESSSESEMPAPKKVKMENGLLRATPKRSKQVPEPIKMKREDDGLERSQDKSELSRKKKSQYNAPSTNSVHKGDSESESSSEKEVPVPQPQKIKSEFSKMLKATVAGKTKLPIPPPRKIKKGHPAEASSSDSEDEPVLLNKAQVSAQESSSESSSEGEIPAPKKKKRNKQVPEPIDMKQKNSNSERSHERSKGKSDLSWREKSQLNAQSITSVRRDDSESESSSEEEVPVPRPQKIKSESSKAPKVTVPGKTKSTPSPRSMEERPAAKATSDSEDESVPPPKKAKLESSRPSVTPKLHRQIPLPIVIQQEDEDSDENVEGDASISKEKSELSWREKLQYNAMNWTEKLKYHFPGIEKQKVRLHLPETNARYSLLLVPKNIDPQSLVNLKCNLNKETIINLNNRECVFEPLPKKPDPVVVNLDGPRLVQLQSVLSLHQSVPELALKELNVPKRQNIMLPSAIKARHPLFGVNYKPKLSLDKTVKRKLQEAMEQKRKVEEKGRRRRKVKKKEIFIFE